jgi:hypothetical protein
MLHRWRGIRRSKLLAAAFAVAGLVALAVAVGIAKADPSENAGYRVPICHNGKTIVADHAAVPALLALGDTAGECP